MRTFISSTLEDLVPSHSSCPVRISQNRLSYQGIKYGCCTYWVHSQPVQLLDQVGVSFAVVCHHWQDSGM
jgi:hypothetical protein